MSRGTVGGAASGAVGRAASEREVLRLAPPVILWWIWVAFVVVNVCDYAAQGLPSARFGAVVAAILLLVTGLAYTLALRPRVVIDGSGVTVVNPYRAHHVPWRLITSVDTGEWVRVHYVPSAPISPTSGSDSQKAECWALYVSARAKRRIARDQGRGAGLGRGAGFGRGGGFGPGQTPGSSRMPDEARYLASLPVAKAMAVRLDKRAARERARTSAVSGDSADAGSGQAPGAEPVSNWSWPAIAAVVVPALILVAVALA